MFYSNPKHNNFLGIILIILGSIAIFAAVGEFLFRLIVALFGFYLIYSGLQLRSQHQKFFFLFRKFKDKFNRF